MSLKRGRMQKVALKEREQDVTHSWYSEAFQSVLCSIYPLSRSMAVQMYGEQVKDMRLMLVLPGVELHEYMGVCVHVPPEACPDYRIVGAPEVWATHTRAHLERIPEDERGSGR